MRMENSVGWLPYQLVDNKANSSGEGSDRL